MALVLKDRVKEQSTTTGTGDFTLSGAYDGYQAFSVIGNGNVTYYTIYDPATGDWEVGYGTYVSSGTKLVRDYVYDSSNSGNLVDFATGTKEVFCTYPSEQAIYQEVNGNLKLVGGVIGLTQDGTEGTTLPNTSFQAFTTGNYYMQANQQNLSSGAESSSDWVCTADNGDDEENYMDMGMASSGYNYSGFSAFKANSGYIVSTGSDLRLIAGKFGAVTPGGQDIVLVAGSLLDTEERVRVYGDTGNVNIGGGVNATDLGQRLQVVGSASISGAATFGSTVTLNADPSTALQAATKQYVDNAASTGIHIHDPCASETSAALSAVYTQGGTTFDITDITGNKTLTTSANHGLSVGDEIWLYTTAGNGLSTNTAYFVYSTPALNQLTVSLTFGGAELTGLTNASGLTYNTRANSGVGAYLEASANQALPISGVSVSDRVLVYNQATGYWNGVYTVTALGAADPGGSKWKLTRATDANKYEPSNTQGLGAGDYFFIQSNSEAYVLTDPTGPVIIGYDTVTYTLFSSVPAYTVNSPLSLVGTTLSLTTVPANLGGTSFSSYTTGDMLYAAGSTTINKLAVGSSGQTIISAGGLPTWGALDMAGSGVSGVLSESHGGTNQSSYATGDTLYASATNTLSKLSGNTSTTKKYLNQTGTGSASQAPVWDTIDASDIASGTLAVARGGTGLSSYAVGDIVYASGTGTLAGLADVATGNVLLSGGTNTAPAYGKVNLGTHIAGTLPIANGGTGQTTAQAAINSLAGAVTSGYYLRGNGTNVVMSAIQAADVPTLNQNTTGSAGSVANALTVNNSGSGDASGMTFNGSAAKTISYNTIGAPKADGTGASGTWAINVSGNAATATTATNQSGGTVNATTGTFSSTLNYTNQLSINGKVNTYSAEGTATNGQNRLAARLYTLGKKVYLDETFVYSTNSINVYDNAGTGTVTISRVSSSGLAAPNNSGFVVKIQHAGSAQSPGYGGFYFGAQSRANATLACVFRAKLPSGYSLNFASNSTGTGGTSYWATDSIGTGKWEDYVYVVRCGDTGSFSSTMFFYVSGSPAPSAGSPLIWYLSSATVYDVDNRDNINCDGYQPLTTNNYSSYALPLSGGTMSGTIYSQNSSIVIGQASGATRGYLYNDTGGFGLLSNGGSWAVQIPYGGDYANIYNSCRSPIFYDSNDTGYYVDPNSTSNIYYLSASRVACGYDAGVGGSMSVNAWFRTSGADGLYYASYGRGIFPPDGTVSYGNNCVYGSGLNGWQGWAVNNSNNCILMSNASTHGLYSPTGGIWLMSMDTSGNTTFNGNVTAYSDLRLKENVREIDNVIERRNTLAKAAIKYERDGRTRIGYGAQTLRENGCDEFVIEAEDDAYKLATGTGILSVDYGETAAVLAVTSKMTDDRVEALEARIAYLESIIKEKLQ